MGSTTAGRKNEWAVVVIMARYTGISFEGFMHNFVCGSFFSVLGKLGDKFIKLGDKILKRCDKLFLI